MTDVQELRRDMREASVFPVPAADGKWGLALLGIDEEVLPLFARLVAELDEFYNKDEATGAALAINMMLSFVVDNWEEMA